MKHLLVTAVALAALTWLVDCSAQAPLTPRAAFPAAVLTPVTQTGIHDARAEFRQVFCEVLQQSALRDSPDGNCASWLHKLADEPAPTAAQSRAGATQPQFELVFIPGIFGECVQHHVTIFGDAIGQLQHMGYASSIIPVRGRASSHHNARIIRNEILAKAAARPGLRLLIVAYSKGVPDSLEALVDYPEIRVHVAGLASVAGVVNGTPLADRNEKLYESSIGRLPFSDCPVIDHGDVGSLTRAERLQWLSVNSLPADIPYFSLVALPSTDRVSRVLKAMHSILSAVDERNDSQVIYYDAVIPGSYLLGYANADHWAIALPFEQQAPLLAATLVDRNHFPRTQLLQALVLFVEEILRTRLSGATGQR